MHIYHDLCFGILYSAFLLYLMRNTGRRMILPHYSCTLSVQTIWSLLISDAYFRHFLSGITEAQNYFSILQREINCIKGRNIKQIGLGGLWFRRVTINRIKLQSKISCCEMYICLHLLLFDIDIFI